MKYQIIKPPPVLNPYVQHFWIMDVPDAMFEPFVINSYVDDRTGIIFHCSAHEKPALVTNGTPLPGFFLYGQATIPATTLFTSGLSSVGVVFYPYAIQELFKTDAHYLRDERVPMNEFCKWNIRDALHETTDPYKRIQLLCDFILKKANGEKKPDLIIKDSIKRIKLAKDTIIVKQLAQYYRISERQLERRFLNTIGVTPRHYIKVTRFNKALELLKKGDYEKLSNIAYKLNYSDQAHFYRTIKELSGYCPKSLQGKLDTWMLNLVKDNC